ncbi:unnamed protein product [Mycena citricolor]|uniref:Methyltransferase domain-containing protein n=1 Tax=Mycena citricolor TaxID=2018698 RepID=A0AAD2K005_9AGAR|nr:unnamed protein product [Mycena citricolor]
MSRPAPWQICVAVTIVLTLVLLSQDHVPAASMSNIHQVFRGSSAATRPVGRLNQTLDGNERRYQAAIRERREFIDKIGGLDQPAFPAPFTAFYTLWDLYAPIFSCPFQAFRVGTMGDGGKWVCGFERVIQQDRCIVYSMGVNHQSSFEQQILRGSKSCTVYGFDFSVSNWGPELVADTAVNARAHFYPWKITGVDNHGAVPKEYSFHGIMKEFGHEFVDILKIDIEGSEFEVLAAIVESFKGQPLPFGQMQIEIHVGYALQTDTIRTFDRWWTLLEDAGLRPFWTEPNLPDINFLRRGPPVVEWSFLNIRGHHALLDDSLPDFP